MKDKDERIMKEKMFLFDFWGHTKKRYDAYLTHMEYITTDNEEWQVVVGCAVEYFALILASYGNSFTRDSDKMTARANLQTIVGEMWDLLEKTKGTKNDPINIFSSAQHKETIN